MVFVCTLPADKKEGNICFLFINTCLNLLSNYFIFLYYNEIVKQIIHIIYFGLWKSKIRLSFINKIFFFLTQRSILLSITKLNFWMFSFRFDIETIQYRSFIIEELVLSLTSLVDDHEDCTDEISISDVNSHKNFSCEYLYVPKNVLL